MDQIKVGEKFSFRVDQLFENEGKMFVHATLCPKIRVGSLSKISIEYELSEQIIFPGEIVTNTLLDYLIFEDINKIESDFLDKIFHSHFDNIAPAAKQICVKLKKKDVNENGDTVLVIRLEEQ